MRLLLTIVFSLCASCVSNPDAEAHRLMLWNFRYEADKDNEYRIYDRIDRPFYGDCEDAAFTLQKQIGGDVWYVLLNNGTAHAALVKNGIVYDNRKARPTLKSDYDGNFRFIMSAK